MARLIGNTLSKPRVWRHALLAGSLLVAGACGGESSPDSKDGSTTAKAAASSTSTTQPETYALVHGSHHVETSQFGSDSFADFTHAAGVSDHLDVGQQVDVDCLATGPEAAAPSAHGLWYHVLGPKPYEDLYVPANTFENGDPKNMNLSVDPAVPACPSE